MENVSEALIMAGQVLIFIIALSVCISSFTTLRVGIDSTINQTETIKFAKDTDGYINFIQSRDSDATRIVGAETIVSAMYRATKEDFTMYLKLTNTTFNQVRTKLGTDNNEIKYNIDENWLKITIASDANYKSNALLKNGLYDVIKDSKFMEYLGEYQEHTSEGVSSENKKVNRIITYKEI